jgi:tetratricopeptide (TPR) repeat protein
MDTRRRAGPPAAIREIAAGCALCLSLTATSALSATAAAGATDALGASAGAGVASVSPSDVVGFIGREFNRFRAHARFDRAFRLLAGHQLDAAAREFADGLALEPDHLAARLGYAQLLGQRGAYAASAAQLDAVRPQDADVLPALRLRAQMRASAGQSDAAIADQQAVAAHPAASAAERRFALETVSDLQLRLGRFDQALAALDRLPAAQRDDTPTLVRRALVYEKMQRFDEAAAAYGEAATRADAAARRAQWRDAARVASTMAEVRHAQTVAFALNLPATASAAAARSDPQAVSAAVARRSARDAAAAPARRLAFAQAKAGDWAAAADTQERLLVRSGLPVAERIEVLGQRAYALSQLGRHDDAAGMLERVVAESGGGTASAYERLAHAYAQAGRPEGVADAQRRALAVPVPSPEDWLSLARRLAALQQTLGRTDDAIGTYRALLARAPGDAQAHLAVGILLRRQDRWREAEPHLAAALGEGHDAVAALELARGLKANGQAVAAIGVLERIRTAEAVPASRKQVLDELGYLHEATLDLSRAAAAWNESLALAPEARIGLALANVQLRDGQGEAARGTLDALAAATPLDDDAQAERLDMRWRIETAGRRHEAAREAAEQALALRPSAPRRFHVGLSERELGRLPQAVAQFEQAAAEDDRTEYLEALAYGHRAAGAYPEAARTFETLLLRDPGRDALYADLAYTYMRAGDNDRAAEWFKRAIDRRIERDETVKLVQAPGARLPAPEPRREDDQLRAMRDEVRKLSERWSLSAYESLRGGRADRASTVAGAESTGLIPSQGGVEVSWRPPVVGLRDERTLDVFARVLWSNQPGSLRIDNASRQGGIGVRYKPLREQSFYLSAERLVGIGDNAQDDWLLRASYGWSDGYEMRANQDAWNYTTLFADVGAFSDRDHTRALYVEGRQGRSFRVGDRWIVTPHVVADARRQWPDPGRFDYAEVGAGVSARYVFNASRYTTARSSAEVLLQYKKGFDAAKSGWLLTTVLRF